MLVRISGAHPFRLAFVTTVVETEGSDEVTDAVEAVAEAVAEVAEDVAEAVADAVSDVSSSEVPSEWVERIVRLELAVEAIGLAVAELQGTAQAAASIATEALEVAEEATTPEEVAEIVEATPDPQPETEVEDATDEPPAGVGRSLLFADKHELRARLFKRGSQD